MHVQSHAAVIKFRRADCGPREQVGIPVLARLEVIGYHLQNHLIYNALHSIVKLERTFCKTDLMKHKQSQ